MPPSTPTANRTLDIDWSALVDGRMRRFRRGADYTGPGDAVARAGKAAAVELGKEASTTVEQIHKWEYVWIQFFDGRIERGKPCPRCGSRLLEEVQYYFAHCPQCDAFLSLLSPKGDDLPEPEDLGEVRQVRMLSPEGKEIDRLSVFDSALIEVICEFFQPVAAVYPRITFFTEDDRKALRVAGPETISVPGPETVRFELKLGPGLLYPGRYAMASSFPLRVGEDDASRISITRDEPLSFEVFDPRVAEREDGARERPLHLHWTVDRDHPPQRAGDGDGGTAAS